VPVVTLSSPKGGCGKSTTALILAAVAALRWRNKRGRARIAAYAVLGALALQLLMGASMVLKGFPLALATAHNHSRT